MDAMMTKPVENDRFKPITATTIRSMTRLTNVLVLGPLAFLLCTLAAPLQAEPVRSGAVGVEDLRAFADAWGYIKDHYVDEIDDRSLLEAAIRGMVSELDPHSAWLSADQLQDVEEQATGRYGGLGIRIAVNHDHLQVIASMGNSPAERAGILPGDRIVAIDDTRLNESNASMASEWLRGAPGTLIALTVEREGQPDAILLDLTREIIRRTSVTLDHLPGGYAHLKINNFQQNTASELDDALASLDNPAGLILDLRNNPGGMLHAAVAVSDRFLSEKLVVYTDGRGSTATQRFTSSRGEAYAGVPMVVLVDRASASASEIVAGALQDHGRAIVLGEPTYGKGSVQTVWPLRNGGGMRLTTALYHTPSGRQIQSHGINPDILGGALNSPTSENADAWLDEAMALFKNAERLYQGSGRLE
jgi:carboxyl-terminal processing protease